MPQDLAPIYQTIASNITSPDGQCVLILGPELAVNKDGKGYKSFFKELIPAGNSKYFDSENLFSFEDERLKQKIRTEVRKFYENVGDPALLEMISRIKFPLIINVCPDKSLNKIYETKGIDFNVRTNDPSAKSKTVYFTKDSKPIFNNLCYPTKESPVIYNIFGSIDLDQSLILTHSKLYETIEYLLPEKSLPDNIEFFLKTVNSFVFLGFKYNSWYYQLICHKLGINSSIDAKTSLSTPESDNDDIVNVIMKNSFNMEFTGENPTQCIHHILEECGDDLRDKNPNGSYSTFISYARNDQSNPQRENIVDLIEAGFKKDETYLFQFFRDRNDITYGDSIDSFMTRIGMGKTVIRVISDKYLKSIYCMVEALRVEQYNDLDKRVFTIVMEDADLTLNNPYKQFWFDECQNILNDKNRLDKNYFDNYVKVYRFIDDFIDRIKNCVHLKLNYADVLKDNNGDTEIIIEKKIAYDDFFNTVMQKLKQD